MIGDSVRRISALLLVLLACLGASATSLILASSASATTYTPEAPVLDAIEGGPWNTSQGDSSAGEAYPFSDLLPAFTPGGPETTLGGVSEPNVAVYPSAEEPKVPPYPSGVAGTPGPLSGYCNKEESENEKGSPVSQPAGTKLPFSPYYFPDVVRNPDGSLTGYFDYRPKDGDEAITVAHSIDNGRTWTSEGKALEQNPGYCPTADTNDDGQGHPFAATLGGTTDLYTLQRQAGDSPGIGLLVHQVNPAAANPLSTIPASQPVGIDPNTFVTTSTTVPSTGGVPIPVSTLGTAGAPEQIVNGSYEDVPAGNSEPSSSTIINCSGPTSAPSTPGPGSLTGCTSATGGSVSLSPGDDLIQVIATGNPTSSSGSRDCATIGSQVPSGPNNPEGTGGLSALCYSQPGTPVAPITDFLWGSLAPNRVYMNGETVYCNGVSSGRVKLENCTTTGAPFKYTAASEITADPIIPPNATMTTGLEAPDGIIGSLGTGLTTYNGHSVPAEANVILYTEKIVNYYDVGIVNGDITKSGNYSSGKVTLPLSASFTPPQTQAQWLNYQPSPTSNEGVPAADEAPASGSFTVYVGVTDASGNFIQPLKCTSWEPGSLTTGTKPPAGSVNLIGCNEQGTSAESIAEETEVGGPNAAVVPYSVLKQTGEGKNGKTSGPTELFGNNEDLSLVRAAYTTNGVSFTDLGAISSESVTDSGEDSGAYTDLSNPNQQESPESSANPTVATTSPTAPTNLSPGSPDTVELRYIGSRGTIVTNPDGSLGMFLSGAWPSDGDSDAFNQIFYTSSTNGGQTWSVPKVVLSTEYEFNASREQDEALAKGKNEALGISAYYSGRAYGPAVVQNPNGSLTMVFSGYRLPKPITSVGTELGTGSSKYKIGAKDPAIYRNILTMQLTSATSPGVATTTSLSSSNEGTGTVGSPVTYTATIAPVSPGVGTPTGTVSFSDSYGPIAGCGAEPLSLSAPDRATCTTALAHAGADEVTASYAGDANYAGSSGTTSETVDQAPAITSASSATFTEGTEGSFTVTATGTPTPGITESGTLPNGVEFNPTTDVLSGTPTQDGTYAITFTATNGVGAGVEQSFTLTVDAAPTITSGGATTFTEGTEGSFTVTATGNPTPTITESGPLPNGVKFDVATDVLSGTPTREGVYPIKFTATNGVGFSTQSFTLTVDAPPAITSADEATFSYGAPGAFTVTASGTPQPTIAKWGDLPTGVSYSDGVLSGTPTQIGTFQITFTASNGIGANSIQQFTLTVLGLHVTTTALPEVTLSAHYAQQLTAVGGLTPYKWKVTAGHLPRGLRLSSTGLLSGTVSARRYPSGGSFPITVRVTDATARVHQTATATFTLLVS
ncbi:MAG: putative Ig domain-containing protein [Solirubrobacteraceae bacterium]